MKKWHIVYPYKQPTDKGFGWELKYSMRSLYNNLKCDFDITIIGDIPDWVDSTEVTCIDYDNININGQRQTKINQKILKACDFYDDFIVFNDDINVMNPIYPEVLMIPRKTGNTLNYTDRKISQTNSFNSQMKNAYYILKDLGKQFNVNFVSHCPHYYETKKIKEIQKTIDLAPIGFPEKPSVVFENVYYNFFNEDGETSDFFRYGCWGRGCKEYARQDILNYDERGAGCNPWIKELLGKRFPKKCKGEK